MTDTGTQGALLERERELEALESALSAAREGTGGLVLVEGHAGVGKSRLLDAAALRARQSAIGVLRARGSEHEAGFGFGVALQLFEPLLANADDKRRDTLLGGAAGLAAPLLERPGRRDADEEGERSYAVVHGLFRLLANLAEVEPVLVLVDDAHWADRPSLRLLLYVLQRLQDMPVTVVAARRLGEPRAPEDLLTQIAVHSATQRLRPQALSREAAREMVADRGLPAAEPPFADACWRMTEGNPFLLGELVRAVAQEGWEPVAANASRIGDLAPETVLHAVAVRLMRLSDDAAAVARAVAVLGVDGQLRHVAALANLDAATVEAAVDALAAGDILRAAGNRGLAFAHPLLASAVYADVGTAERGGLHRRAAEILRAEGVASALVAAHLMRTPGAGEAWAVEVLRNAAEAASQLGAPDSASGYLRRALDEPPSAQDRFAVLCALGVSEAASGLPTAIPMLQEALAAAGEPAQEGQALLALGAAQAAAGRRSDAVESYAAAVAPLQACGDPRAARAVDETLVLRLVAARGRAAALAVAAEGAGPAGPALARTLAGAIVGRAREHAPELVAWTVGAIDPDAMGTTLYAAALTLDAADELAAEERMLTAAVTAARNRGSVFAFASASCWRAGPRRASGRLVEALADAERAVDARLNGWGQFLPGAYGLLVQLLLERGQVEDAASRARELDPQELENGLDMGLLRQARGRIALIERRDEDALGEFTAWGQAAEGVQDPGLIAGWRSATAVALVRLGRMPEARALVNEELALARAHSGPRALSTAMRALALLEVEEDIERAATTLAGAVEVVRDSEARLEYCLALLDLGVALRRAGRRSDAGRALGEALELARAFGARLYEERAAEELEVSGARVQRAALRGVEALSPSERRVVALAVEGLNNREIAEALFVTRKAVEWHLGNAYRKLEVRSRGELPKAIGGAALSTDT